MTLNTTGIGLHAVLIRLASDSSATSPAYVLWLVSLTCLIFGVSVLVYRRGAADGLGARIIGTLISTFISTALAVVCWEFVLSPGKSPDLHLLPRLVKIAFPIGDMVVIALMVRLLLGGGVRNPALAMMIGSLLCFLGGDLGWAVVAYRGESASATLVRALESADMGAFSFMGAAALHPGALVLGAPARAPEDSPPTNRFVLASIAASALAAPAAVCLQVFIDLAYDTVRN